MKTELPTETRERIERIAAEFSGMDYYLNETLEHNLRLALTQLAEEERWEREKDAARLDWLEVWAKKSPTGISFDHVKACEGDPSGFRFMRRFHIGQPHKSVRAAIDVEMDHNPPNS